MKRFLARVLLLVATALPTSATAEAQSADINSARVSYETCGNGPRTVVLMHDGLANAAAWDGVWPALCKQYRVVRYDRRGYGGTPVATAAYAPVDDLSGLLKHLGIARASFIAASAGGGIATEFALSSPATVEKLILVGPAIAGYPYAPDFLERLKPFIEAMRKGDRAGAIAAISANPHMIAPDNKAARERLAAIMKKDQIDTGAGFQRHAPDTMKRVGELRAPTLIVVGAADDPQNIGQAEALKVMIPSVRVETVPNAGHLVYVEQPDTFVRLVTGFLK
jgi:pimeloyl-ACP methyl ester carboxylesterase